MQSPERDFPVRASHGGMVFAGGEESNCWESESSDRRLRRSEKGNVWGGFEGRVLKTFVFFDRRMLFSWRPEDSTIQDNSIAGAGRVMVVLLSNLREEDGDVEGSVQEVVPVPSPQAQLEAAERKARVNAAWEQMNRGKSATIPKSFTNERSSTVKKRSQKAAPVTEVRDFAGEEIEVKKLVDADSKEAAEKTKVSVGPPSAVDAVLEQIKKKTKLSVLDKTKKDWGEFKEEKGLEEELDAYKKSSNQYLDKVSFLQRTDYREFERERDVRLALQAKRRPDMREEP
ncbi:hypothetical protein HHK36_020943 [Tetracentron sinense]|uniref:BCNT-C domain-containing protein n=1 Tax=Tetracentron sinense TaxID=13715 RepID=A0A835D9A4_TETSI|nr:hypothetical protein HHK36_020943 [Tetracentron sinense]